MTDTRMREWTRLVGETGDLADIVVAVLSLASAEHNLPRVDLDQFYGAFTDLRAKFPNVIPELDATGLERLRVLARAIRRARERSSSRRSNSKPTLSVPGRSRRTGQERTFKGLAQEPGLSS